MHARARPGGFLKHIFRYELIHEQIRRTLTSVPHRRGALRGSGARSGGRLGGILQPLGLAFDPHQLAWAEAEKHEVAGNHVRFDAKSDLVLDEGWKKSLSPLRQSAIDLGTPISRQTMPKTGAVR